MKKKELSWSNSTTLPKKEQFVPKTALGKKLYQVRKEIEAAGHANMTVDDIIAYIDEQRGRDCTDFDCPSCLCENAVIKESDARIPNEKKIRCVRCGYTEVFRNDN